MIRDLIENGSVNDVITTVIALLILAALLLSFVFLIWGGLQFILSAGDEDKVGTATRTIRSCIIGLLMVFIAFFIVRLGTQLFDLPFELSFDEITGTMSDILASLQ